METQKRTLQMYRSALSACGIIFSFGFVGIHAVVSLTIDLLYFAPFLSLSLFPYVRDGPVNVAASLSAAP